MRKLPTLERFNEENYLFEVLENGNSYTDYSLSGLTLYPGHVRIRIKAPNSASRGLDKPMIMIHDSIGLNAEV